MKHDVQRSLQLFSYGIEVLNNHSRKFEVTMVENFTKRVLNIRFKVFTEKDVSNFAGVFEAAASALSKTQISENAIDKFYEIATDGKMYSGNSYSDFTTLYKSNYSPEYILWSASIRALPGSTHPVRASVRVLIDKRSGSTSYVEVLGPDKTWVDGTFQQFSEQLDSAKSTNRWVRSEIINTFVQFGLISIVAGAAIATAQFAGRAAGNETASIYTFVIVFACLLTVSNLIQRVLFRLRDQLYPAVEIRVGPRDRISFVVMSFIFTSSASWALKKIFDVVFSATT